MIRARVILACLAAPFLVGGGAFLLGIASAAKPRPAAMFPTYEQVTAAGTVLVHQLESDYQAVLAHSPDYIGCDRLTNPRVEPGVRASVRCVFLVTFYDDTSAYYAIYLNRADDPVLGKKLKGLPASIGAPA